MTTEAQSSLCTDTYHMGKKTHDRQTGDSIRKIDVPFCKLDTLIGHIHIDFRLIQNNLDIKVTGLHIKVEKDSTEY